MTLYEIALRKEVLMEIGAEQCARCFRLEDTPVAETTLFQVVREEVTAAQRALLKTAKLADIDRIEGEFNFAKKVLSVLEQSTCLI